MRIQSNEVFTPIKFFIFILYDLGYVSVTYRVYVKIIKSE